MNSKRNRFFWGLRVSMGLLMHCNLEEKGCLKKRWVIFYLVDKNKTSFKLTKMVVNNVATVKHFHLYG